MRVLIKPYIEPFAHVLFYFFMAISKRKKVRGSPTSILLIRQTSPRPTPSLHKQVSPTAHVSIFGSRKNKARDLTRLIRSPLATIGITLSLSAFRSWHSFSTIRRRSRPLFPITFVSIESVSTLKIFRWSRASLLNSIELLFSSSE